MQTKQCDKNEEENSAECMNSLLLFIAKAARIGDSVLTSVLCALLLLILAFTGYSMWDTVQIYNGAETDSSLLKFKPDLSSDNRQSFEELRAINPEICAWITIDGTNIDYPVVQGTDNYKYLNMNVSGEYSLSGSIFLDFRNSPDFSDSYSLIYGHHMDADVMFGEISDFTDQEYFNSHQTGNLYLPGNAYEIDIFSCVQANAYDELIFSPGNLSTEQFSMFFDHIKELSVQFRETGITYADHLIALSTCSDAASDDRIIIFGRLAEINEEGGKT